MLNEFKIKNVEIPRMLYDPTSMGVLKSHYCDDILSMINVLINLITHADDGACCFNNTDDSLKCCETMCKVMSKWDLTLRIGQNGKKLKTEAMFFHLLQP